MTVSTTLTSTEMAAWQGFLHAQWSIGGQLDHDLREQHGMTIHDYDVLVHLRDAEKHSMRMSGLAECVLMTRSGMTRLVDGLVKDGLVKRRSCKKDARVSYAVITKAGLERLATARVTHHDGIRRTFSDHFSHDELELLAELMSRLKGEDSTEADLSPC